MNYNCCTTAIFCTVLSATFLIVSCSATPPNGEGTNIQKIQHSQVTFQQQNVNKLRQKNRKESLNNKKSYQREPLKKAQQPSTRQYNSQRILHDVNNKKRSVSNNGKRVRITLLADNDGRRLLSPEGNYRGKYNNSVLPPNFESRKISRQSQYLQQEIGSRNWSVSREHVKDQQGFKKNIIPQGSREVEPSKVDSQKNIPHETVEIGGKSYVVPPPWAGHRLKAPKFSRETFAQIPAIYVHDGHTTYIQKSAYQPLLDMIEAARRDGIVLQVETAYRDTRFQRSIFIRKFSEGRSWADLVRYHAPPGYSEHMLGLAVDFYPSGWKFASSAQYRWLRAHAGRFGFIESYPKIVRANGLPLAWESWHWCYGDTRRLKSGAETAEENRMPLGIQTKAEKRSIEKQHSSETVLLPEEDDEKTEFSAPKEFSQTLLLPGEDAEREAITIKTKDDALLKSLPRVYNRQTPQPQVLKNSPTISQQEALKKDLEDNEEIVAPLDNGDVQELYKALSDALKSPENSGGGNSQ